MLAARLLVHAESRLVQQLLLAGVRMGQFRIDSRFAKPHPRPVDQPGARRIDSLHSRQISGDPARAGRFVLQALRGFFQMRQTPRSSTGQAARPACPYDRR